LSKIAEGAFEQNLVSSAMIAKVGLFAVTQAFTPTNLD